MAIVRCLLLFCTVSLSFSPATYVSDGGGGHVYRLLVMHTNDMHSRFGQIDRTGGQCDQGAWDCYGGFARIRTAVDRARADAVGTADGTLFLNAGDTFQGSTFYSFLRWPAVARMVQLLGFDVISLGNHEFDNGVNDVQSFIRNITIPVVASNLDLSNEPLLANEPNLMKSIVLTVNGRKIGIIGYLTPETVNISSVENVIILSEIPSIIAEAKRLKTEGINILIALGHSGFEMDIQIAQQVEDIDLVIGGHSHTFLYTGNAPGKEKPIGPYPFLVEQPMTHRTVPVVQASHNTKYLGKLWLEFDEAGEIVKSYGNPILLDSHINQDSELLNTVKYFEQIIEDKTNYVIGTTSVFLDGIGDYCRVRECNFGNFIMDSFIDYNLRTNYKSFDLTKHWTDAPIAIMQSGGIRSNINHTTRNGNITFGNLLSSMPFQNDVGKVTTKGSDIWAAFEYSVRRYNGKIPYGEFLQVSGLRAIIDFSRSSGKRVQSIHARCGNCVVPVYEKLDLKANYTIIMSRYLSNGGDGIKFTKVVDYQSLKTSELEIMIKEIGKKSPIRPEVDQRMVLLNEEMLMQKSSGQPVVMLQSSCMILLTILIIIIYMNLSSS